MCALYLRRYERAFCSTKLVRGASEKTVTERETAHLDATGTEWLEPPWPVAFELSRLLPHRSWTLVGGLMVSLHAKLAGLPQPRTTTDVDSALHLETGVVSFAQTAALLQKAGFTLNRETKYAYRFERIVATQQRPDRVDVLCADRYVAKNKPAYLGRPLFGVAGGTRALKETINVDLSTGSGNVALVIPNIRGALVLKGAAYLEDSRDKMRHAEDAVVLLACLTETDHILDGFSSESRKRVTAMMAVLNESTLPWVNHTPQVQSLAKEILMALVKEVDEK